MLLFSYFYSMKSPDYWINFLKLEQHPEGGYYKETYRSVEKVLNRNREVRVASTGIYFLITSENFSAFHKIESDEMWHHYDGAALSVYIIQPSGKLELIRVGKNAENGEQLQAVVPAGCWFASRVDTQNSFSLVGCTVAPGFDFQDFVLASRDKLISTFPQHKKIISELTRG